ncbi:MAG: phage portal protein [Candidatus Heimdallarchaeaceae archaeon]
MQLENLIKLAYPEETKDRTYSVFTNSQVAQLNALIKYYDYYENNVFKYIEKKYPEFRQTTERSPAQIPINYSRYIVDKLANWQFEKPIDISVSTDKKALEKKAEVIEKDLYDIHKANNMNLKLQQAAKECNTSGGVVFKMIYDNDLGIRFLPRPRIECFPITGFDDYEKLSKIHFIAFKSDDIIWKQTFELVDGKCLFEEATYNVKENLKVEEVIQKPIYLGNGKIDFIPVYIIPNNPSLGMIWGYSELEDLIPIIDELVKKYSDASDSLRFEMFAITIMLNIKQFSDAQGKKSKPKTKPGAVWNLISAGAGDVKPEISKLESRFAYTETLKNHMDTLKDIMFELSSVVQINPATISKLGNLSGVALKLMFASIISKTNAKNTIWKPSLEQMYSDSLKMRSIYESYSYPEDVNVEIIQHVPIPQNEVEQIDIAVKKLTVGLSSVKREMDLMGVENPEMLMAEILEEQKEADKNLTDVYGAK